ncbi:MAG TPA: hypothetical protein VMA77_00045 [Solirubrobacteraceae bacterium]|nr:hypothetical protein [Solirubrobacteraceae bacterium]
MKAMPYDAPGPGGPAPDAPAPDASEEEWGDYDEEAGQDYELPRRPRRQWFNRWTAGGLALLLGAIGFYVGVRVEKNQLSNSTTTSAFSSALAGAASRTGGTSGTSAASRTGGAGGAGAFRSLFAGGGFTGAGGAGATAGTVSSVNGDSLYITESSGNMVKVTVSSATKVTKSQTVGKDAVRPGDTVVVTGAKSSDGSVSAATVSDTGVSAAAAAGSGSSSSGSSASGAVSSLFGGGGG